MVTTRRPRKYPKVLELRDETGLDRISSLPDELIAHILSFLPTLSAVKTSILSTRWRYLFTLTTNLSFNDAEYYSFHDVPMDYGNEAFKKTFETFVYGILALHSVSPIQKFSLQCNYQYGCSHLLVWISAAILKRVKRLQLHLNPYPNSLPQCIFNSRTLVILEIDSHSPKYYQLKIPGLVSLPSLRILELCKIIFPDGDSVNRLFVGCSQLKELTLDRCELLNTDHAHISAKALRNLTASHCKGHFVIDAPNVENLWYACSPNTADVDVTSSLKTPCSLHTVELGFVDSAGYEPPQIVLDIIRGAYYVRNFVLLYNSVKVLPMVKEDQIPYSKLESLYLGFCCYDTWKYVTFWLANSLQLETIIFGMGLLDYDAMYTVQPKIALDPFSSNIKTIEIRQFVGHKLELLLVKYLLENAKVLKRLILVKCSSMKYEKELQVSKKLLKLPKASKYCIIELK
ncbi:putative F-box protein At3g44060 isoform X2 [Silene latifolia]|uniref:putative F-box protein At3g44060 isoform X2 n=1 Tax=Silene latifolia TaxID=37657 RepID=UPI003D77E5F2